MYDKETRAELQEIERMEDIKIENQINSITRDIKFVLVSKGASKMKRAFSLELLIIFFSGVGTILIWEGNWIVSSVGFVVIGLTSFIVGELKRATLEEYIEKTQEKTK